VITGDVPASYALDVERRTDGEGERVAVELTTSSISSGGDGAPILDSGRAFLAGNLHLHHVGQRRGYLRCRLQPGVLTADVRTLPAVERPGAPIGTARAFTVEAGNPQLR
jgi:alkaline phosphatase D